MKIAAFAGHRPTPGHRLLLTLGGLALMTGTSGALGGASERLAASDRPAAVRLAALTPAGQTTAADFPADVRWNAAVPLEIVGIVARTDEPVPGTGYLFVDPQEAGKLLLQGGARADGAGRVLFARPSATWNRSGPPAPRVRVTTSVDGLVSLSVRASDMQSALVRHGAMPSVVGGYALAARVMDGAMSSVIDGGLVPRANCVSERDGLVVLSHVADAP